MMVSIPGLKKVIRHVSIFLSGMAALGLAILLLLANWRKIIRADLVIMHWSGGFGYTITTPDLVRRDRIGQRVVIIFAYVPGTHSRDVCKIWRDVDLMFMPVAFRRPFIQKFHPDDEHAPIISLIPYSENWRKNLFCLIGQCLRILKSPRRVMSYEEYLGTHSEIELPAGRPRWDCWVPTYLRLLREVPAPPLQLSEKDRRQVAGALERAAGKKAKYCCLYLRLRGSDNQPDAYLRSGSDVATNSLAVKRLNERGYQVLLIGDRGLPVELFSEFAGMFVDARNLNLPEGLFYLFAATESQISIGECGGGFWLSPINNIPSMLTNNYPFHIGWNNMVLYFKVLEKEDGSIVPAKEMFEKYGEDVVHTNPRVLESCAEELEAAVSHFVDSVARGSGFGTPAKDVPGTKEHHWSVLSNSYVSPIWMALYGSGKPIRAEERAAKVKSLVLDLSH